MCLFNSNVKNVLLYEIESWTENKVNINKLLTFINRFLWIIYYIFRPNRITNRKLWEFTCVKKVEISLEQTEFNWTGHTLRKL